jgi:hypothetical protein
VPWSLKGSYVETCSCDLICPCNATFDHGAKYDYCRVTLVFSIREGDVNERTSGGLRIAAIADTPKVMTEGNWRLGVFVDDRATDDQAEKLIAVFTGRLGGPMAGIAPLVGEMCLGKCRSPLGFLLGAWRDGRRGALRMGVRHGAWCVGCCWPALMASLFALGL